MYTHVTYSQFTCVQFQYCSPYILSVYVHVVSILFPLHTLSLRACSFNIVPLTYSQFTCVQFQYCSPYILSVYVRAVSILFPLQGRHSVKKPVQQNCTKQHMALLPETFKDNRPIEPHKFGHLQVSGTGFLSECQSPPITYYKHTHSTCMCL